MKKGTKYGKLNLILINTFIFIFIISFVLIVSGADNPIDITGTVSNNGPVDEGNEITFRGSCTGDTKQLIVCRGDVICNSETSGNDLICKGDFVGEDIVSCNYLTKSTDIGTNSGNDTLLLGADLGGYVGLASAVGRLRLPLACGILCRAGRQGLSSDSPWLSQPWQARGGLYQA